MPQLQPAHMTFIEAQQLQFQLIPYITIFFQTKEWLVLASIIAFILNQPDLQPPIITIYIQQQALMVIMQHKKTLLLVGKIYFLMMQIRQTLTLILLSLLPTYI